MAIYDFFLSRNNGPTLANYVGHTGRLFYDSATGEIRISDGTTAGGLPIPITIATASTVGGVRPGAGFTVSPSGVLSLAAGPSFYLDETNTFRLRPGSADLIGGIKAGPGIVIDSEGTLFIDTEGLEFSFGDFTGTVGTYSDSTNYALLSSVNADEDIVIASNGTGDIKVVGGFEVYATNGTVTGSLEDEEPFFRILDDGQVRILVPLADTTEGGVEIIGSLLGTALTPGIAGTMLHMTGNANLPTRVYHDTLGEYSSYVFRRYNGSVITPTAVLANEDIGRINFTAATNAGMGNVATAQITVTALENQSTTAQGSEITLRVTPVGATAANRVDALVVKGTGIELPTAGTTVKLSGSTSGTTTIQASAIAGTTAITLPAVTGTVVTTGDTGTVTNTMLAGSIANAKLANSTISGTALGGTLAALSAGNYLTGTDYTGATARTFAVDATTAATASKVVARDANADVYARRFVGKQIHAVRDAGNPGGTLTLDFATDEIVVATLTADVTLAYSNLLAGSEVTLILQKTGGGTDQVNVALNEINIAPPSLPGTDNNFDFAEGECCIIRFISTGTTTGTLYASIAYDQF